MGREYLGCIFGVVDDEVDHAFSTVVGRRQRLDVDARISQKLPYLREDAGPVVGSYDDLLAYLKQKRML